MNRLACIVLALCAIFTSCTKKISEPSSVLKPRIVIMTDIGPAEVEPDDNESAVRLMAYADRFEIEGIITTIGWNCDPYPTDWAIYLTRVIDAYKIDVQNLMKRSGQSGFQSIEQENGKQELGYWPSYEYISSRAMMGSTRAGIGVIGPDNDSPGSNLLIRLADEDDDRPIWLCSWGGANTFAQAVWRIKQERSPEELKKFLNKFRLYTITDQDMQWSMRMNRAYSSHQWLRRDYSQDLMLVWDESAWLNQNDLGKANWDKYESLIQGKGAMGKVYPKFLWGVEGDTPSMLHVMPNGLNDPDDPTQIGWGGCHQFGISPDRETYAWTNWQQPLKDISNTYEHKFYPDEFNDFAARMQWADTGTGNHNPVAVINGTQDLKPMKLTAMPGQKLKFDASASFDPDGDKLTFNWWFQEFPDETTYPAIDNPETAKVSVTVPENSQGKTYHLICEIHDDGPFNLTAYRRIIISNEADGRRYCNPLPMVIGQGGNASGDVSVFRDDDGRYYMFCTGGGAWHSDNMLDWDFTPVQRVPVAPDVVKYRGKYYMSGNDCPLYVADNPLGPYSVLGEWENTPDVEGGWNEPFDMHIFIDGDTPYLFYSGRGISGIFGVPLDPDHLNRFADKPTHLFSFNPKHEWERYGEMNEYTGVAWIEGPWLFKYKGTYYMQYSASGTQWKTYAEGYYTAKHPLGPYTYADNNPLLRKTEGLVTGTAHGSVVEGPDGGLWQFYTIVLSNPPGGRRIGMDRINVDKNGRWSVQITDTPQPAPGVKSARASLPVTINKMNAMNALSKFSSQQPGRYASYAVDNSSGTVWEPDPSDPEPSITIELSPATRFDEVQLFDVDAVRIMFNTGGRRGFGGGGGAGTVYKYKVDVSLDGETYTTVLDKTANTKQRNTIFEEFKPVEARYVRLTVTEWPGTQLGVIEFTAFGLPSRTEPARVAIPPVITY